MNPLRDWGAVTQLMRVAFQTEITFPSLPLLPEGPWAQWLGGLLGAAAALGIESPEQMLGYVWEADGALVGNVTLGLAAAPAGIWLLSNVAVHPDQRRQGIARALVEAAIEEARRRGGRWMTLQVKGDNVGARELYLRLGFRTVETISEFSGTEIAPPAPAPGALHLARPTAEQWQAVRARSAVHLPAALHGYRHSLSGTFNYPHRRSWLGRLAEFAGGTITNAWSLLRGENVVGGMLVQTQLSWGAHRVAITVEPAAQASAEQMLLEQALAQTKAFASRRVHFAFPASHQAMSELLRRQGAREVRALDLMALAL